MFFHFLKNKFENSAKYFKTFRQRTRSPCSWVLEILVYFKVQHEIDSWHFQNLLGLFRNSWNFKNLSTFRQLLFSLFQRTLWKKPQKPMYSIGRFFGFFKGSPHVSCRCDEGQDLITYLFSDCNHCAMYSLGRFFWFSRGPSYEKRKIKVVYMSSNFKRCHEIQNYTFAKISAVYLMWNPEICQNPPKHGEGDLDFFFVFFFINTFKN